MSYFDESKRKYPTAHRGWHGGNWIGGTEVPRARFVAGGVTGTVVLPRLCRVCGATTFAPENPCPMCRAPIRGKA